MGSLHKNTHLMLEFLKAVFLVLHFSYYTLMTFLMLSVILLSMLMILLCALSVITYLELASKLESDTQDTVDWDRKWLADFNAGKTQLVSSGWSNNIGCYSCENGWICS